MFRIFKKCLLPIDGRVVGHPTQSQGQTVVRQQEANSKYGVIAPEDGSKYCIILWNYYIDY